MNSLIPGGAADTDFVSARGRAAIAQTGRKLLPPQVMIAPLLWLCSSEADGVSAARYVGKLWDDGLPPAQAARGALEPPVLRTPGPRLEARLRGHEKSTKLQPDRPWQGLRAPPKARPGERQ